MDFGIWLLARAGEDSPVGDLGADFKTDVASGRMMMRDTTTPGAFRRALSKRTAGRGLEPEVVAAIDEAIEEFERE